MIGVNRKLLVGLTIIASLVGCGKGEDVQIKTVYVDRVIEKEVIVEKIVEVEVSSGNLVSSFWKKWRNSGSFYKNGNIHLTSRFGMVSEYHNKPIWTTDLPDSIEVVRGVILPDTQVMIELYKWQCYYKRDNDNTFVQDYCTHSADFSSAGPARMQCIEMIVIGQDDLEVRGEFPMIVVEGA